MQGADLGLTEGIITKIHRLKRNPATTAVDFDENSTPHVKSIAGRLRRMTTSYSGTHQGC